MGPEGSKFVGKESEWEVEARKAVRQVLAQVGSSLLVTYPGGPAMDPVSIIHDETVRWTTKARVALSGPHIPEGNVDVQD